MYCVVPTIKYMEAVGRLGVPGIEGRKAVYAEHRFLRTILYDLAVVNTYMSYVSAETHTVYCWLSVAVDSTGKPTSVYLSMIVVSVLYIYRYCLLIILQTIPF